MPIIILLLFVPSIAFAFGVEQLLDPVFWAPYTAILLAVSEFLALTDTVKANGILAWIVDVIIQALKK